MAWNSEFEDLMPDGVSVLPIASWSTDGYGMLVAGTASTYKARIVRKQTLVRVRSPVPKRSLGRSCGSLRHRPRIFRLNR